MGELRLDIKSRALGGGVSGNAIVPGNSAASLLVRRVLGLESKPRMPLEGTPLSGAQIAVIRTWIDQGAPWPDDETSAGNTGKHWAYVKPLRPPLPQVRNRAWVRKPIDSFVLARLEKEGLSPSPEASRETLIRRLSLDLTGLPPPIEEVDAFLADQSPDAYEKAVERLLASHHYGERWARPWLDSARFADTNGYADNRRTVWKYRDWVINAFNQDMPFDKFTIEQIAGDMLPNAGLDQKIATGFHRNTMFNDEGGVDQEEARWLINVDRVNTTATVWLGTTLACAQCHDHKHDPFAQKDYYRLLAFFENADYRVEGEGPYQLYIEPVLELPTAQQEKERQNLREEIGRLESILKIQTPELAKAQVQWERVEAPRQAVWRMLDLVDLTSNVGAGFTKNDDQSVSATPYGEKPSYTITAKADLKGIRAFQLEVLPDKSLPARGPGRAEDGNFVLTSFRVQVASQSQEKKAEALRLSAARADFSQEGFSITAVLDDDPETGWGILPQAGRAHTAVFETEAPVGDGGSLTLIFTLDHQSQKKDAAIGRFRLSASTAPDPPPALPLPDKTRSILSTAPDQRTEEQRDELASYYRSISPLLLPERDRLSELKEKLAKLSIVTTLVMGEKPVWEKPSTYVRIRGSFLSKGQKVYAGVPTVLHPLPETEAANRLGLARWLVDENNPLVARVTVNRIWEQIFGRGIVETSEDFGTKGARPTHPDLLDWLATEFMSQGWSMKALLRLIVTSATYRQSSAITPALRERDPENRLLARGPRFRVEAEMIRDVALAASGLLDRKIGGPSVFPYQPEGVWNQPYYRDYHWVISPGSDRYRRGIYTFCRRTTPYPSFIAFDATSREFCTPRRIRSNTPVQALTTLNDLAFLDAAKALAGRIMTETASQTQGRVAHGFRLCLSRHPKPKELEVLTDLYQEQLRYFQQASQAAADLTEGFSGPSGKLNRAELAAWTVVSNVLLNLDQTLSKE